MKRIFQFAARLSFVTALAFVFGCERAQPDSKADVKTEITWLTNYDDAIAQAKSSGKLVVVDFFATWCGPCKLMDRETFADAKIQQWLAQFVPLKIDVDQQRQLAERYEIEVLPTTMVLDANGKRLAGEVGYLDADQYLSVLARATNHVDSTNAAAELQFTNRLINSKSPHLLQHAHNPVDWYPWGEEAFAKARKENKPIFLSVGYSTCHWCHVMEHESFENLEIAHILNDNFVCIKVDREERPDVDGVYMTFVQATTGNGGWPMSVWLTPDLKPFFGGTYFPPQQFAALLEKIAASWKTEGDKIRASSDSITRQLQQFAARSPAETKIDTTFLDDGYAQIKSSYDSRFGGFGDAPKFPRPVAFNFLLRYYARTGRQDALDMTLFTLHKMAEGGLHDHIGGGFHRYSTDARWHVPHFEKMLYDQAQLACSYLDAYQITHDKFYADVARDILDYVQRDMTGADGQFYSAEDADGPLPENPAKHAEGAFYVWTQKEIADALDKDTADIFDFYYGVERNGNVENDSRGELSGKNVLIVSHTVADTAKKFSKSPDEIQKALTDARRKLFAVRAKRPRPFLDDKTITAWNGLMISAFARGYQLLGDPKYLATAEKSAQFIQSKLYDAKTGKLLRRYRDGDPSIDSFASDYAFLIQGLLDLYEASFDINDLAWTETLQKKQNERFWDNEHGGYFSTTGQDTNILLHTKEDYDGAEPSPNSVSALNLLRLGEMLDNKEFRQMADEIIRAFGEQLKRAPSAMPQMLAALDFDSAKPKQIVIAGNPEAPDTRAMLQAVNEHFIPNKIVLLADGGKGQAFLGEHLEFIHDIKPNGGKATAFVCKNYICQLPTTDIAAMVKNIESK